MVDRIKGTIFNRFVKFIPPFTPGVRIFTYHGVVKMSRKSHIERNFLTNSEFESNMNYLKRSNVVGLDDLFEILNSKKKNTSAISVITFDDGYENNIIAAEIMKKHQLKGIFFLSSGYIETNHSIWTVNLSLLLLHGSLNSVVFQNNRYTLRFFEERLNSFRHIRNIMKILPTELKNLEMQALISQFPSGELDSLISMFPHVKMMTWENARQLLSAGFDVQSHGHFHEIHNIHQSSETIENEIILSKSTIETKLNSKVIAFAYPNGDFTSGSKLMLQKHGFELGFSSFPGPVLGIEDHLALPRFPSNGKTWKMARNSSLFSL